MKNSRTPATTETLEIRRRQAMADQDASNLPEFDAKKAGDPKIAKYIADQEGRIAAAVRDADEIVFETTIGSWLKACYRVNEIIADEYRAANPDPATWELRYFKWMTRVQYILFESPLGEFAIVPRRGRRVPAKHWYTADEMIGILGNPAIGETIKMLGTLPVRPESLPGPAEGEKHLHIDATGPQVQARFEFHGGSHAGARLR